MLPFLSDHSATSQGFLFAKLFSILLPPFLCTANSKAEEKPQNKRNVQKEKSPCNRRFCDRKGERTILYICHLLGSGFQICFKGCDFSFLQVVRDRHINIERGRYIGVTKHRLHDLYIQTALAHSCSECMP